MCTLVAMSMWNRDDVSVDDRSDFSKWPGTPFINMEYFNFSMDK